MLSELFTALEETLFMVFSAGLFTWCIGLPLGVLLKEKIDSPIYPYFYRGLSFALHSLNTVPYLILMIALIPLSRKFMGFDQGSIAAIVPMTIAAIPAFAKSTENALNNVPKGVIDLAISIGATRWQIIYKILIPEAFPTILQALTETFIRLFGFAIVAGALGCGGLGELAMQKGYSQGQFEVDYLVALVILSIIIIQMIQKAGQFLISGKLMLKNR